MSDKPAKDKETGRFLTGNIGGGRTKGSRNKLGEAFVQDVYAKWMDKGEAALDEMIANEPGAFVRVVAGILPKELVVKDELSEVSDEELAALVAAAREALSNRTNGGAEAPAKGGKKQAKNIPTIQ